MSKQISVFVDDLEFIRSQIERIWAFFELCRQTIIVLPDSQDDSERAEMVLDAVINAMEELNKMFLDLVSDPVFDKILEEKEKESEVQ